MAFLEEGKWYRVAFKHTNDPAWAALPQPRPGIPSVLMDVIVGNQSAVIYVIDAIGTFAMYGTTVYQWDDTLLLGASELPSFVLDTEDGTQTRWCRSANHVYRFDEADGTLRRITNAEASAFKAFLP